MTTDGLKLVRIGNATSELKMKKQRNGVLKNRDAVVVVNSTAPIEWRIDIFRVQWLRFSFRPWYLYKKVTCRNTRSIAGHFLEE